MAFFTYYIASSKSFSNKKNFFFCGSLGYNNFPLLKGMDFDITKYRI